MRKPVPGLFITGTDTDVGKTYVGALVARHLYAAGHRVGVYKPVASGCEVDEQGNLVAQDAVALWQAAGGPATLAQVCPQRFAAPLAPPRAAQAEGSLVDTVLMRSGLAPWLESSDVVLVEGAGGLMSPLADGELVADLARDLGYPLIVVALNKLGTINATLQTLVAARAYGLQVAGIVLNHTHAGAGDASVRTNREDLAILADVPVLAEVAWQSEEFSPAVDWFALARAPE